MDFLSNLSKIEHIDDAISLLDNIYPLSDSVKKALDDVSEELLKKLAVPEAKSNRNISLDPYESEDSYAEHLINKYTVK